MSDVRTSNEYTLANAERLLTVAVDGFAGFEGDPTDEPSKPFAALEDGLAIIKELMARASGETFDDSATLASMADKLRAIAIRDESRGLSTTGLESAAREIEWAARRDRASMKAGERLDAVLGDRPRPRPNVDEMGTPTPCSTCNGTGEVDESLGGSPGSNRHAPCPDCSGT